MTCSFPPQADLLHIRGACGHDDKALLKQALAAYDAYLQVCVCTPKAIAASNVTREQQESGAHVKDAV